MRACTLTKIHRQPGELLDTAAVQPVALTRHGRVRFVIMSADHYEGLTKGGGGSGGGDAGDAQPAEADEETGPETQSQLTLI